MGRLLYRVNDIYRRTTDLEHSGDDGLKDAAGPAGLGHEHDHDGLVARAVARGNASVSARLDRHCSLLYPPLELAEGELPRVVGGVGVEVLVARRVPRHHRLRGGGAAAAQRACTHKHD
jgi:hypothetical protein